MLNKCSRDGVDIGCHRRAGNRETTAIDEDQVPGRSKIPEVKGRGAERLAGLCRVGRRAFQLIAPELRRIKKEVFRVFGAGECIFFLSDHVYRSGRLEPPIDQARTRDDDRVEGALFILRLVALGVRLDSDGVFLGQRMHRREENTRQSEGGCRTQ